MEFATFFKRAATQASCGVLACGCFLSSCSQRSEPLGVAAHAILNGTDDTTDNAVVGIDSMLPTGEEICSGYLIMPDLVLTARHCAAPVENPTSGCTTTVMATGGPPIDPSKLGVYTDAAVTALSKPASVAEVTVLDGSTGQSLCGNDLAILRLTSPVAGVTPIALALKGPPKVGDTFTAIGYGVPSPTALDQSGTRRSRGGLMVAAVGASSRTVDGEWIADTGPCGGDSGSPAIDATGASFGVMTRGPKATCVSMIYERVDVHADFLIAQARASATRLGIPVPAWAAPNGTGGGGGGGAGGTGPTPKHHTSSTTSGCSVGRTTGSRPTNVSVTIFLLGAVALRRRARAARSSRYRRASS